MTTKNRRTAHNKLTQDTINQWCNRHNIEFLDEHYVNNQHKHTWRCIAHGYTYKKRFCKLQVSERLPCCVKEQISEHHKTLIVEIETRLNITLLSPYKNELTPMLWKCNVHGLNFVNNRSNLKRSRGKPPCCRAGKHGHTLEYIQEYARSRNAVFLDNRYKGTHVKHRWLCLVHNLENITSFSIFGRGCLLACCNLENKSGKNNPRYNAAVSDHDRVYDRRSTKNKTWRQQVLRRDNCTCRKCSLHISERKMTAHHIFSYLDNVDRRYDVENGITLCVQCHTEFHKRYGRGRNTESQIREFLLSSS